MKFSGIIAMDQNRLIGNGNKLPWHCKADLKFFKEKTWGGHVIMGRKTYEGLGRATLPNRTIWVLSRYLQPEVPIAGVHFVDDIEELPDLHYWVAGGLNVYKQFIPLMQEFYVSFIRGCYEGDVYAPAFEHLFTAVRVEFASPDFEVRRFYSEN